MASDSQLKAGGRGEEQQLLEGQCRQVRAKIAASTVKLAMRSMTAKSAKQALCQLKGSASTAGRFQGGFRATLIQKAANLPRCRSCADRCNYCSKAGPAKCDHCRDPGPFWENRSATVEHGKEGIRRRNPEVFRASA